MTGKTLVICDLKTRRHALGWSLHDLSKRCGIDEAFLSDWEHGIDSPRLDALEAWATALGLKVSMTTATSAAGRGLKVEWQARRVTVDGAPIRLTPMEWKALERLARTPGELVTHQDLFRHLYGDEADYRAQSTAIRVLITKLRRLLPLRIDAQWGRGYVVSGIDTQAPDSEAGECGSAAETSSAPVAEPHREVSRAYRPESWHKAEPDQPRQVKASFAAEKLQHERITFLPRPAPRAMPSAIRRELVDLAAPAVRRLAVPQPARAGLCRAEELGVIERFLAERGVTRCPDVATIEQSPLPTLVWDKMKRKWVRPANREAS